jgi:sRNA-binding regulator protein Hfq
MASTTAAAPTAPTAPAGAPDPPIPAAPAAKAARRPWPNDRVQNAWYERNRDRPVRVRFLDGSGLSGVLIGADTYTLSLRVADREEPVLIPKHAVAFLARQEAQDRQPGPPAPTPAATPQAPGLEGQP